MCLNIVIKTPRDNFHVVAILLMQINIHVKNIVHDLVPVHVYRKFGTSFC